MKTWKILITGASRGIGAYLLEKLLDEGYSVYGTYCSTLPAIDKKQYYAKVDITNQMDIDCWIQDVATFDDDLVLLNCAGVNYNVLARKADTEKWKQLIELNLVGTFRVIRAVLPLMHERKFGRIINFSSVVAQKGIPGTSAYAASKAALWGMSKCLAVENADRGITINTINLGYMDVGMTYSAVPDNMRDTVVSKIPVKRFGTTSEIFRTVLYLINTEYINGSSIDLNGGLY